MTTIKISKGLNIPIKGDPKGLPETLHTPISEVGLHLGDFNFKFHLLAKVGDSVKIGSPLVQDKLYPERIFVSPGAGTVKEIRRGLKRAITDIVISLDRDETFVSFPPLNVEKATRAELLERISQGGLFAKIRSRPLDLLADPKKTPKNIFVKALESAPFVPPAEMQVEGHEKEFQEGLNALAKLTDGSVHLVYFQETSLKAFKEAKNVIHHEAVGPHPIANPSLHIQRIAPITSMEDTTWTLSALDVVSLGYLLLKGKPFIDRIVSVAGPAILPDRARYLKLREGYPLLPLISNRLAKGSHRLISGDPLSGRKVTQDDFLGLNDFVFCAVPETEEREFLHFFRLGADKYSFSRAYLSGHLDQSEREYNFTTSLHGEHRPFIDSSLYDKVQPLDISTMLLVKAIMAEDFESAETLGILEVAPEDFALPTFVCPSKMEMTSIVKRGLELYAKDLLG